MGQRSEINLSPDSWHAKLIDWVFGYKPGDFRNLCPYFWLLVASIFLVIPVTPFKLLGKLRIKIADLADKYFSKKVDDAFERFLDNLSKGEIYCLLGDTEQDIVEKPEFYKKKYFINRDLRRRLLKVTRGTDLMTRLKEALIKKYKGNSKWKSWNKEFETAADSIELMMAAKEKKHEELQVKSKSRKETIADITNITKASVTYFVFIGTFVLLYFASWILLFGLTHIFTMSLEDFLEFLKILGALVLIVIGTLYGVWCIAEINELREDNYSKTWFEWVFLIPALPLAAILWGLKFIFVNILWEYALRDISIGIVKGFMEYGGIFAEYFNASYSDYCPGINWEKKKK